MKAEQFDSLLRWFVQSDSRAGVKHLVELDTFNGNGSCACEDFSFNRLDQLKHGVKPSDATRCKHIRFVRGILADRMIAEFAKQPQNGGAAPEKRKRAPAGKGNVERF